MSVQVTFLGRLGDSHGPDRAVAATRVSELRRLLDLQDATIRMAVNDVIVPGDAPLVPGDRVACLPPVGGG